jgi:hypothetical protein
VAVSEHEFLAGKGHADGSAVGEVEHLVLLVDAEVVESYQFGGV